MPHHRNRHIEAVIKKLLSISPLVGLLGHRQVGKTTVLEKIAKKYYVLDSKADSTLIRQNPDLYLQERAGSWVALDECQNSPELFPALKELVRKNKKPGQFILSGSVRFTSREQIKESLTGRIMTAELFPLTLPELEHSPLSKSVEKILGASDLESFVHQNPVNVALLKKFHSRLDQYFIQGGLPGVCFLRNEKIRNGKIREQLLTILDRDLRMVKSILVPYGDILNLVEMLARQQGAPLNISGLKKETGLSGPTIKKIIYALEAVFILRILRIEGSTKGETVFFEDMGERLFLSGESANESQNLGHFLFTNIRPQLEYQTSENIRYFQYRTRGGAYLPFCVSSKQGTVGFLPVGDPDDVERYLASASSFLGAYNQSKVIFVHRENRPLKVLRPRILLAPVGYLLQ